MFRRFNMNNFGRNIQEFRYSHEPKKITKNQFADLIAKIMGANKCVSDKSISKWENGECYPSFKTYDCYFKSNR